MFFLLGQTHRPNPYTPEASSYLNLTILLKTTNCRCWPGKVGGSKLTMWKFNEKVKVWPTFVLTPFHRRGQLIPTAACSWSSPWCLTQTITDISQFYSKLIFVQKLLFCVNIVTCYRTTLKTWQFAMLIEFYCHIPVWNYNNKICYK